MKQNSDQQGAKRTESQLKPLDFKSIEERDNYFRDNADYYTLVRKNGVGSYERNEYKTLAQAEQVAQTKVAINGGGYMIYAVIGEQSAFVKAIR